jgi:hypothetical protein
MWFVEIVKSIAWPVVVLILALTYKRNLSDHLSAFFRRGFAFEAAGIKARIEAAEQQQSTATNPSSEKLLANVQIEPNPRAAVNILEEQIRRDLSNIDSTKREPILFRALTIARLGASHEWTYNRIFGSQIDALKKLNEVSQATVDDARAFFRPYEEKHPEIYSTYGFDGWLGFLRTNSLIRQNGVLLEISDFGRDFLFYMIDQRLSEAKPW